MTFDQDQVDHSKQLNMIQKEFLNIEEMNVFSTTLKPYNAKNCEYKNFTPNSKYKVLQVDLETGFETVLFDPTWYTHKDSFVQKFEELKSLRTFKDKYIIQLNNLVPTGLKDVLNNLIDEDGDFSIQPWTNGMTKNYIHPSTSPYVKDVTKIIQRGNLTEFDQLFQWLPANVKIEDGKAYFTSPISGLGTSNLDKNKDYQPLIEEIFGLFVPHFYNLFHQLRKDDFYHLYGKRKNENGWFKPKDFEHPYFQFKKCQVIVKLQEITLDEEHKLFKEGHLHLEGTRYEHIVATGIYYLQNKNVEDTNIDFYVKLNEWWKQQYSWDDANPFFEEIGCSDLRKRIETVPFQSYEKDVYRKYAKIGTVQTHEDLCLIFPNFLYHKVGEVHLKDTQDVIKEGKRRILVFWLVNPNLKIISTAHVEQKKMCEQEDCYIKEQFKIYQEMLMIERKYKFGETVNQKEESENESEEDHCWSDRESSLCEH